MRSKKKELARAERALYAKVEQMRELLDARERALDQVCVCVRACECVVFVGSLSMCLVCDVCPGYLSSSLRFLPLSLSLTVILQREASYEVRLRKLTRLQREDHMRLVMAEFQVSAREYPMHKTCASFLGPNSNREQGRCTARNRPSPCLLILTAP